MSDATAVDDEQYREYEDLRKYFKNQQLVVSAADRGDIPDFGDFRRRNMGRMRLKNGERTNVDQVYAELSEMYPEFFDQTRESQPSDQLYRIADVLDAVYSVNEYNPNAQYMREATQSVGNEILEQFFDLPQQRTFADLQAKKADSTRSTSCARPMTRASRSCARRTGNGCRKPWPENARNATSRLRG